MRGQTMNTDMPLLATSAAALAEAFDRTFAAEPAGATGDHVDLLALRLGVHAFVVRLAEAAGVYADRRTTPTPTAVPEFVGIAGVRGRLTPVFDLASLMGYGAGEQARWLLVARAAPIAFSFEQFEGQLRVEKDAFVAHGVARQHIAEVVHQAGVARPVIGIASLVASVGALAGDAPLRKEL